MTASVLRAYARAFGLAGPPESIEAMHGHLAAVPNAELRAVLRRALAAAKERRTARTGVAWEVGTVPASWVQHAPSRAFPHAVNLGFWCPMHDVEHIDRWVDGVPALPTYGYDRCVGGPVAITSQTPVRPARNR